MKDFLNELIDYHEDINNQIIEKLLVNKDQVSTRCLALLSHSIIAQQIWNARILNKTPMALDTRLSIDECKRLIQKCNVETRHILSSIALDLNIQYHNSKGDTFKNSVQDIIFHLTNHYSHHRGHLLNEMRASGITPIITDYIFYKRN